ncbi:MAG: 4-hydroxythreonine-4-phosphate dehydrogenase PdxA [Gammaproteobacteria bacterium]
MIQRILLTPGEPAGIGPDIIIQIAQQQWPAELIVVADPDLMQRRAKQLNLSLKLIPFDSDKEACSHTPGTLKIIPLTLKTACVAGQLNLENSAYVIQSLEIATDYCLKQIADALVTGPVHKGIINDAGIKFSGHTEFLATRCHATDVVMLFVTPQTKVALATTHLPLRKVSSAITTEKLISMLRILHQELIKKFNLVTPRILVCGLNPHAGESGHLGREEIDIIEPALAQLRDEKINVLGPFAADTIFTEKQLAKSDAVLAMYHDQALPVVKYMSFGHGVNVTLGLPIIRTSVDHGIALDVAGTNLADAGSFTAALRVAIDLTANNA